MGGPFAKQARSDELLKKCYCRNSGELEKIVEADPASEFLPIVLKSRGHEFFTKTKVEKKFQERETEKRKIAKKSKSELKRNQSLEDFWAPRKSPKEKSPKQRT